MFGFLPCHRIFLFPVSPQPQIQLFNFLWPQLTHRLLLRSETRHKTLEEIASAFGDEVVLVTEHDVAAEGGIIDKAGAEYAESVEHR